GGGEPAVPAGGGALRAVQVTLGAGRGTGGAAEQGSELRVSQPRISRLCPAAVPSRWIAGTVLCSIILLILACNVTGMALGAYGLSKREDPSDYECRGEAGAKFLLVGVGLAFLFSWLLILLVFATFLVGGNIQTLVCRNWVNQEIYKFIDTPGNLPPSMNVTHQLNLRRDSNLSSVYRECKSGAGLWEVLQLDRSYDLDEHLKTPKVRAGSSQSCRQRQADAGAYAADFQKRLGDFTANLGDVRLLRSEGRQDLETFARSGVDEVDYGRFHEESQEALVVSPCWAGGSGATGTPLNGTTRFLNLSYLSVPQAKLGESVQFLSRLAPHLKWKPGYPCKPSRSSGSTSTGSGRR
ncbi:Prominin-2, partial [Lamprotornis superbus]